MNKIVHIHVNRRLNGVVLEYSTMYTDDEVVLAVAARLSSPVECVHILSHEGSVLHVFSLLDFLKDRTARLSREDFEECRDEVHRFLPSFDTKQLLMMWLHPQLHRTTTPTGTRLLREIATAVNIELLDDFASENAQYHAYIQTQINDVRTRERALVGRTQKLLSYTHSERLRVPFALRRTRVAMECTSPHSMYFFLDRCVLSSREWCCAVYKEYMRLHPSLTMTDAVRVMENGDDVDYDSLTLFHHDGEQRVVMTPRGEGGVPPNKPQAQKGGTSSSQTQKGGTMTYTVSLDISPTFAMSTLHTYVQRLFPSLQTVDEARTMSVSGAFYIHHYRMEKVTWHDFVMNDPLACAYVHIQELERAQRQSHHAYIRYGKQASCTLINDDHDTVPRPTSFLYFRGKYIRCAVTSAVDTKAVDRVQIIVHCLLGRYREVYVMLTGLYKEVLPQYEMKGLKFPKPAAMTSNDDDTTNEGEDEGEEAQLSNYAERYKYVFKKTGYKTKCRPKTRMPTIISQEEASTMNPLYVIQFPRENDTTWQVPREYLTCSDPAFPFPGVTPLAGGSDAVVPCCFYKNPRNSAHFLAYYTGKTIEDKGTEHIKSEYQIIKTFGDLGRLPLPVSFFLTPLAPEYIWYRSGTVDTVASVLHTMEWACRGERRTEDALRRQLRDVIISYPDVCRQEGDENDILSIIDDRDAYIDPRYVYRALECLYDVHLIVLTKAKHEDIISCMVPSYRGYHLRSVFVPSRPFVFVYEHWGTSPDRYTKRAFPVCELLVSTHPTLLKSFTFDTAMTQSLNAVYRDVFLTSGVEVMAPRLEIDTSKIHRMIFDSWGKMRGIMYIDSIESPSTVIGIHFDRPLATLHVPRASPSVRYRQRLPTMSELTRLFGRQRFTISSTTHGEMYARGMLFGGGVSCTIRIARDASLSLTGEPLAFPPPPLDMNPTSSNVSSTLYRKKQYARMLMDYIVWMYGKKRGEFDSITDFVTRSTTIAPDYVYPHRVSEVYTENPQFFDTKGRLIVTSEEMRRRLAFVLRHHIRYSSSSSSSPSSLSYLPRFWASPLDFSSPHVFRRSSSMHTLPYTVTTSSLNDLSSASGLWFLYTERPLRSEICPYVFQRVETVDVAKAYTAYWSTYKSIPLFPLPPPSQSSQPDDGAHPLVEWDGQSWSNGNEKGTFVVKNTHHMYVLLPIGV
jgi:hypothetical protein